MNEQTYIRFPKHEHPQRTNRLTDPSTYATATWRNTTPLGGMIGIGFYTGTNITTTVKLDKENAQLLMESLRDYLEIEPDTEPTGKAAASTELKTNSMSEINLKSASRCDADRSGMSQERHEPG